MSEIFVIVYEVPAAPVSTRHLYQFGQDRSSPLPHQSETNTHFIARPWPQQFQLLAGLRSTPALDVPVGVQPETNTNFLARFSQPNFARLPMLSADTSVSGPLPTQPETQPHFLGRFTAPTFARLPVVSYDSIVQQAPPNPHFLGRYTQPSFSRLPPLSTDTSESGPPPLLDGANGIFVIAYDDQYVDPGVISRLLYRSPDTSESGPLPTQPETQPHFIGRFTQPSFARLPILSYEPNPPPVQSPNPHFLGKFTPPSFSRLPVLSTDTSRNGPLTQPDTASNFLATFDPGTYSLLGLLRGGGGGDYTPVAETNTHFLAQPWPVSYQVSVALRQNPALDKPPPVVPDSNTHFLGKFTPPSFYRLPTLSADTGKSGPLPTQPATNTEFIATPWPLNYQISISLRQNVPFDGSAPPPPIVIPPGGSGKRYAPPTDYLPEPAWDEKPRKPVRPIWDRKHDEQPTRQEPTKPACPPPLPPLSIFRDTPGFDPIKLPQFDQYMVPNALNLAQRLRQAEEQSEAEEREALEALIAAGLLKH